VTHQTFVLSLSCADTRGIVAEVSGYCFGRGCNILHANQFTDRDTDKFFMRVELAAAAELTREELCAGFAPIAERFGMTWTLRDVREVKRVMILVSKLDHCLIDLLYRWRIGELRMDIVAIVANHPREVYAHIDLGTIPFHYLPVTRTTKLEQEVALWKLVQDTRTELVVLARYMQVLSDSLAARLVGRCLNIHHSFLPGFKGAKPYHQAHARGVKLIGATAHFVTGDLDEGPIVEQDVERVSHADTIDDFVRKGRDIERRVLARAVSAVLDDRAILDGAKAVVFS
jgi:formyltetrahydrofolate deformylase